jgi:tRNA-binding protein
MLTKQRSQKFLLMTFSKSICELGQLKARKPAYILTIDFGELGEKMSSAQITDNYSKAELIGKQIIAVVNFPAKRVAGVKSEVLVLGAVTNDKGVVLLEPNLPVENGNRIS